MYTNKIKGFKNFNLNKREQNAIRTLCGDPELNEVEGPPDDLADSSVVTKVRREFTLDLTPYAGGSGTQVDVISWPMPRASTAHRSRVYREAEYSLQGNQINIGGVGLYVQTADKSVFGQGAQYENSLNQTNGNAGYVIALPDENCRGNLRVLSQSFTVHNEGSESYQSGSVTAWEQNSVANLADFISAENWADEAVSVGTVNQQRVVYSAWVTNMPPSSNTEIQNARKTKVIGHAKDGVFVPSCISPSEQIDYPVLRSNIWINNSDITTLAADPGSYNTDVASPQYTDGMCTGPMCQVDQNNDGGGNPISTTSTANTYGFPTRNYYFDGKLRGARFSGLNLTAPGIAKLRIVVTWVIEIIPSAYDTLFGPLAKPTLPPNDNFNECLTKLRQTLDIAYPAKDNADGDFSRGLIKLLSTKVADTPKFDKFSQKAKRIMLTPGNSVNSAIMALPGGTTGLAVAGYLDTKAKKMQRKGNNQSNSVVVVPAHPPKNGGSSSSGVAQAVNTIGTAVGMLSIYLTLKKQYMDLFGSGNNNNRQLEIELLRKLLSTGYTLPLKIAARVAQLQLK